MQFIRSTRCLDVQSKEEWVKELSEYALGLGEAIEKNRGLDEYWLHISGCLLALKYIETHGRSVVSSVL